MGNRPCFSPLKMNHEAPDASMATGQVPSHRRLENCRIQLRAMVNDRQIVFTGLFSTTEKIGAEVERLEPKGRTTSLVATELCKLLIGRQLPLLCTAVRSFLHLPQKNLGNCRFAGGGGLKEDTRPIELGRQQLIDSGDEAAWLPLLLRRRSRISYLHSTSTSESRKSTGRKYVLRA